MKNNRNKMNKQGMELVQVAILIAIAVALGLVFKAQIGTFVDQVFSDLLGSSF
ncbi:MAG: hypothetical protein EOM59_02785 [Clostridia bacterium]|nr:hypothetical protein [Clostridia bacterium]